MGRNRTRWLLVSAWALLAAACAPQTPTTAPDTGTVTIGVITAGAGVQSLSFSVTIDSNPVGTIKADAGVLTRSVPIGEHTIALAGLPAGCRVDGPEERRITVSADRVSPVKFSVLCK